MSRGIAEIEDRVAFPGKSFVQLDHGFAQLGLAALQFRQRPANTIGIGNVFEAERQLDTRLAEEFSRPALGAPV
jgi:hypothetical protein